MKLHGFAVLAMAWCGALVAAGCCCCTPRPCGDCASQQIVAAASCPPPCETACAEPCAPCLSCGVNGPCPKHPGSRGLLGYLRDSICCGASCGELYVHPWINDPPHPCDPCDDYGHWVGPQPCGPASCGNGCPVSWRDLWGHRADQPACCESHAAVGYPEHYDGEILEGPAMQVPTPATPRPMAPQQNMESPDLPPTPPNLPSPTTYNGAPRTRSALKKVDGRPAVYYGRRPQEALR
jgi:hypothetical protein